MISYNIYSILKVINTVIGDIFNYQALIRVEPRINSSLVYTFFMLYKGRFLLGELL